VTREPAEYRPLILWTIGMTALTVIVFWCAYLVRDALLLVYISTLIAIGFSPLVRLIEKQKALPIGSRRFPRWFAILILYLAILGFPRWSARGSRSGRRHPPCSITRSSTSSTRAGSRSV